jgi:hypothetical protein
MTNSQLVFPTEEVGGINIKYFAGDKRTKVADIPEASDLTFITYIQIIQNQTIESISFDLYGSTKYWDLLVLLNNRDPLFDMFYSDILITDFSDEIVNNYESNVYKSVIPSKERAELSEFWLEQVTTSNDNNRVLKIIKPFKLNDFLVIMRKYGYKG